MKEYCKRKIIGKMPILLATTFVILLGMVLSITGCSSNSTLSENENLNKKIHVVATTTMLYDLTKNIVGDNVEVEYLMGAGIDPHLYQASAGDVEKLGKADIVIYNGLHLEGKMGDIFDNLKKNGKKLISAEDGIDKSLLLSDEENKNLHDPHIWFDVKVWMDVADHVANRMKEYDPEHSDDYEKNLNKYINQLKDLDSYIRNRVNELPKDKRILVTAHDAFRYFGKSYGFDVMGLQGISTESEAGASDVSKLADFIATHKIKSIFIESSVPHKNVEALKDAVSSKGFDVGIGGELYSDSLGDKSTKKDSYINMFKYNIDTIVDSLK